MTEKKLTPQERAKKFQEGYVKLCAQFSCQHVYNPVYTPEGRTVVRVDVQINKVNDEQS